MTTIIIKSFNRPHYLDRCLHSIYLHVKGSFEVKVLDDGTPPLYLEKIATKYNVC
ncbi:glycosyltransferase [Empedobacter falsenii]